MEMPRQLSNSTLDLPRGLHREGRIDRYIDLHSITHLRRQRLGRRLERGVQLAGRVLGRLRHRSRAPYLRRRRRPPQRVAQAGGDVDGDGGRARARGGGGRGVARSHRLRRRQCPPRRCRLPSALDAGSPSSDERAS